MRLSEKWKDDEIQVPSKEFEEFRRDFECYRRRALITHCCQGGVCEYYGMYEPTKVTVVETCDLLGPCIRDPEWGKELVKNYRG